MPCTVGEWPGRHSGATLTWLGALSIDTVNRLDPLTEVPDLEGLRVVRCPVKDASILAQLTKLSDVDLDGTEVVDLRPLAGLRRLKRLDVSNCPPEMDLSPLNALPRRAEIWLARDQQVRGLDAVRARHKVRWS